MILCLMEKSGGFMDYRVLLQAPLPIVISDSESDEIIDLNSEACTVFCCQPSDLRGQKIQRIFAEPMLPPDSKYLHYCKDHNMLEVAKLITCRVGNGKTISASVQAKVAPLKHPIVLTSIHDIRKEVHKEELDHSPQFMGTLSFSGQVLLASSAAEALFNVTSENMIGQNIQEFIYREDRGIFNQALKKMNEGAGCCSGVVRLKQTQGVMLLCPMTLYSATECDRQTDNIYITAFDNTQIREQRAEEVLRVQSSSKHHCEVISQYIAKIRRSTDLLSDNLNQLEKNVVFEPSKALVQTAKGDVKNICELLEQAMHFSKIKETHIQVKNVLFSIPVLLHDVISYTNSKAKNKHLRFELNIGSQVPEFYYSDELKIKEILLNLLQNASYFSPANATIKIEINCSELTKDDTVLAFEIHDFGRRISKQEQQKLFQSHIQQDPNFERTFGVAGQSLSLCKALVTLMQGMIGVKSNLTGGNSCFFMMRFLRGEMVASDIPQVDTNYLNKFKKHRLKVLVVDDIATNRLAASKLLEKLGIDSIESAENGKGALEKFKVNNYDLIFMDIQMPEMDGFEAVQHIREYQELTKKKAGIIFASGTNISHHDSCEAGADGCVEKPFNTKNFAAVMEQVLQKYHI